MSSRSYSAAADNSTAKRIGSLCPCSPAHFREGGLDGPHLSSRNVLVCQCQYLQESQSFLRLLIARDVLQHRLRFAIDSDDHRHLALDNVVNDISSLRLELADRLHAIRKFHGRTPYRTEYSLNLVSMPAPMPYCPSRWRRAVKHELVVRCSLATGGRHFAVAAPSVERVPTWLGRRVHERRIDRRFSVPTSFNR